MMEYKGYIGTAAYDARTKLFHGDIVNTRDVLTFQGTTVQEIEKAFRDSIHDYLIRLSRRDRIDQHLIRNSSGKHTGV